MTRVVIKHNIPALRSRLQRLEMAIKTNYRQEITKLLIEAQMFVQNNTPKDRGDMSMGWKLKIIGGSPKGRVPISGVIHNRYAEEDRFKYKDRTAKAKYTKLPYKRKDKDVAAHGATNTIKWRTDGRIVLRGLEYGVRPHTITARPIEAGGPGVLTFKNRQGNWISKESVSHPGNKAYSMIRRTRLKLLNDIIKLNKRMMKEAKRIMSSSSP